MRKATYNTWANLIILGLSVFLVFCLVFESFLELPDMVVWLGHWHPVLLHFPIVILLVLGVMGLIGKQINHHVLALTTIIALLTAVTGFFLGTAQGPKADILFWHQWLGASLAFLVGVWYLLHEQAGIKSIVLKGIQITIIVLIVFTGHYGGMLTHGADFLAFPRKSDTEILPDNPLIYENIVAGVLEKNCVSCHNPNKKKGELLMTRFEHLKKGGSSGVVFVAGQPEDSELIRRLNLPTEDEEHMPPEGKKPLNATEIQILERWIALGASDTMRLSHLEESEPLASLIKMRLNREATPNWDFLPKVADSTLHALTSDYITLKRIAGGSNALSVSVYMPPNYDENLVLSLQKISQNIVELDLSGLPLGTKEMELVALCTNLERLELDRTGIDDTHMAYIQQLAKLKSIKLYATSVSDKSITGLAAMPVLKRIYLWNTKISDLGVQELTKSRPDITVNSGLSKALETDFVQKDSL
ncbi:c-type cytochrome domain-containing protein [Arenibacter sp. GZD96]|uniref:c-type cytochrome domain-containing protein n=1 Tax=Aurantibrevibacter litoralis TaxID=3106030 RepID=UPI002AFEA567|nr:c-type cytochrome domain-containing protein [Arenibacter sp. GZD-96]MEA1786983.1 c-type cytochrome domain-containing protein [Arenibacter sp. GZD-96]